VTVRAAERTQAPVELLYGGLYHGEHFTRGLFGLRVLVPMPIRVAVRAVHAERAAEIGHHRRKLAGRNAFQGLNVVEDLLSGPGQRPQWSSYAEPVPSVLSPRATEAACHARDGRSSRKCGLGRQSSCD